MPSESTVSADPSPSTLTPEVQEHFDSNKQPAIRRNETFNKRHWQSKFRKSTLLHHLLLLRPHFLHAALLPRLIDADTILARHCKNYRSGCSSCRPCKSHVQSCFFFLRSVKFLSIVVLCVLLNNPIISVVE